MEWWQVLGFSNNPLDIRPSTLLIGLEEEEKEILSAIENGEIFLVYGPFGSGKTSLAYRIIHVLREKFLVSYLNGEATPNIDLEKRYRELVYKKLLFFRWRINKKVVFILDELQAFEQPVLQKLKYLYDNNYVHSAMLIQINPVIEKATPSFMDRISRRILIDYPSEDEIIKIIQMRLKNKLEIDEDLIRSIARKNKNNVRAVLIELNNILSKVNIDDIRHRKIKIESLSYSETVEELKTEDISLQFSDQQKKILEKLLISPMTIRELSEILNLPYNTVSKQVSRLYKKGILDKKQVNRNTLYSIKESIKKEIIKQLAK